MKTKILKFIALATVFSILCVALSGCLFDDGKKFDPDNVESGELKENCKVSFFYKNGDEFDEITDETSLLNDFSLEPGGVAFAYIKAVCSGELPYKYTIKLNILEENPGVNVKNEQLYLSEILKFKLIKISKDDVGQFNRQDVADAVSFIGQPQRMTADNEEHYYVLAAYMPNEVGKEAITKPGTESPSLKIGLTTLYEVVDLPNMEAEWYQDGQYIIASEAINPIGSNIIFPGEVFNSFVRVSSLKGDVNSYRLKAEVVDEVLGVRQDGTQFKLSEHISFKLVKVTEAQMLENKSGVVGDDQLEKVMTFTQKGEAHYYALQIEVSQELTSNDLSIHWTTYPSLKVKLILEEVK